MASGGLGHCPPTARLLQSKAGGGGGREEGGQSVAQSMAAACSAASEQELARGGGRARAEYSHVHAQRLPSSTGRQAAQSFRAKKTRDSQNDVERAVEGGVGARGVGCVRVPPRLRVLLPRQKRLGGAPVDGDWPGAEGGGAREVRWSENVAAQPSQSDGKQQRRPGT